MAKESQVLKLEAELGTSRRKLEKVQNELRKELTESKAKISDLSSKLLKLEEENKIYSSRKSALEKIGYSNVYYHMTTSLFGCSGGGWTLVMKVNGKKETFHYGSSYWSNKATYNPGGGLTGFDDQETKLATYWNTPFKEICLGMKVNDDLNFISISYQASSLYDVIADGSYHGTSIGRSKWLSLLRGSGLQSHCNREGFNLYIARIGIIGNQENDCHTPDSFLGFGGLAKYRRLLYCGIPKTSNTSCGNSAYCSPPGGNKEIPAMGYIFVR